MSGADALLRPHASEDARLLLTMDRIDVIARDMSEVKMTMGKLVDAITKMAIVEERQLADRQAMARAFVEIEKVSERLKLVEQGQPIQKQSSDYVQKFIAAAAMAAMGAVGGATWGLNKGPVNQTPSPPAVVGKQ